MQDSAEKTGEIILVVDDEPVVLSYLSGTLARYGYRVLQAHCGAEALRICRERRHAIDLVLTDIVMPELDGRELVDKIRGELELDPRTLFMSGYTRGVAEERGITEWVHFIQKPFTPSQLVKKVREILQQPKSKTA